jgi:hypothetical protein
MPSQSESQRNRVSVALPLLRKGLESFLCVVPIALVVVVLFFTNVIPNFGGEALTGFLLCAVLIAIGLGLFTFGIDQSMSRIGQVVGETLFKKKNIWLVVIMTFLIGVLVTVAEPDLKVMANQIGFDEQLLIIGVGIGVGLFVVFGVLRIIFNKSLNILFLAFYGIVFALAGIVNPKFLPICFDSGGVTTGPVTVPFILAFGAGLAASRAQNGRSGEDAFGLTALASVGPIISVMILSLFADVDSMVFNPSSLNSLVDYTSWDAFWHSFPLVLGQEYIGQLKDVALAIVPIFVFFIIYNFIFVKMPFKSILKIFVGLLYAYFGLVIFMGAVQTGFLPVAQQVGMALGDPSKPELFPIAILIGALFGLFGVLAEPAVHVLVDQIEKISEGTIKSWTVLTTMAISIAGGVALAVVRAHFGFSILYYMIPGYIIAIGLTFVVPKIYSSIAFDSGGVASGPMASTFVMPFAIGFTYANHGGASGGADYVYADAFGCVAMIALMPLIVIQLLGLYAEIKRSLINRKVREGFIEEDDNQIIHLGVVSHEN